MTFICGIEEAGRGPVIGPMVMAGLVIEEPDEKKLVELGVKDSKQLTARQREARYDKILAIAKKYQIVILQPKEIDEAVLSDSMNLNLLEAKTTANILNELKPDKAIIDCPSTNIPKYTEYLRNLLKNKIDLLCAHHADENFPVVSATSIIAKVVRDQEIMNLKKKYNIDFGSGYTSDEKTQSFIEKHWNHYPELFRHSWATFKKQQEKSIQSNLSKF
ncbi:ribonuclease HII [Candidatus Woesearchaeota archaeon]|nr:ribonuclease HII [Candidatus Woesearchaeota archaeon]